MYRQTSEIQYSSIWQCLPTLDTWAFPNKYKKNCDDDAAQGKKERLTRNTELLAHSFPSPLPLKDVYILLRWALNGKRFIHDEKRKKNHTNMNALSCLNPYTSWLHGQSYAIPDHHFITISWWRVAKGQRMGCMDSTLYLVEVAI